VFIRFHFLRDAATPLQALRGDGWQLQHEPGGVVLGTHPAVANEAAARERLHRLGLLTSRALLIRFHHSRRAPGN
jgi:hypothetical protein